MEKLEIQGMDVSKRVLNTSLPWYVHTASIKQLLLLCPKVSLFKGHFILRCVQYLSLIA